MTTTPTGPAAARVARQSTIGLGLMIVSVIVFFNAVPAFVEWLPYAISGLNSGILPDWVLLGFAPPALATIASVIFFFVGARMFRAGIAASRELANEQAAKLRHARDAWQRQQTRAGAQQAGEQFDRLQHRAAELFGSNQQPRPQQRPPQNAPWLGSAPTPRGLPSGMRPVQSGSSSPWVSGTPLQSAPSPFAQPAQRPAPRQPVRQPQPQQQRQPQPHQQQPHHQPTAQHAAPQSARPAGPQQPRQPQPGSRRDELIQRVTERAAAQPAVQQAAQRLGASLPDVAERAPDLVEHLPELIESIGAPAAHGTPRTPSHRGRPSTLTRSTLRSSALSRTSLTLRSLR